MYLIDLSRPPDEVLWWINTFWLVPISLFYESADLANCLSRCSVGNYWNVIRRYLKVLCCILKSNSLTKGLQGICSRRSYQTRAVSFSISWGERYFYQWPESGWSWSDEPDAVYLSTRGSKMFSSSMISGFHLRHPSWWSRLSLDHRRCCSMLAHRHQNWNKQHWPHVLFARVNSTTVKGMSEFFVVLSKD